MRCSFVSIQRRFPPYCISFHCAWILRFVHYGSIANHLKIVNNWFCSPLFPENVFPLTAWEQDINSFFCKGFGSAMRPHKGNLPQGYIVGRHRLIRLAHATVRGVKDHPFRQFRGHAVSLETDDPCGVFIKTGNPFRKRLQVPVKTAV